MRPFLLCLVISALSLSAQAQNLLAGRPPSSAGYAMGRLTDQQSPVDGDPWNGPQAVLLPPAIQLEWDLGAVQTLTGAAIQADNNDFYVVSTSDDGTTWHEAWRAGPIEGGGLRTRSTATPLGSARFIRLEATGGDGRYSVSEFEVFAGGNTDGTTLLHAKWVPRRPLERNFLTWMFAITVLLGLASRRLPRSALLLLGAVGLAGTAFLVFEAAPKTPAATTSLPWIRLAVAFVAAVAVLRERLFRKRWPAHPGFVVGTLGLTGALAVWCFLNLGAPQFHDHAAGHGTWLHHYDMRTYYPIAKYFPELRFDGVYAASVLAVADGRPLEQFNEQPLRDLRTHSGTTVRASMPHLLEVRSRFSAERWSLFLEDMNYFRRAMGDGGFLGSMNDHGGNATPVWFLAARALFSSAPASDNTLWRGVVADVALLGLAFIALAWAFGGRTSLLALTVFGAMDFYQFGSNWFGAALRHDWLSLWAIGLALLHRRKFLWAGVAFAWSAWIRAFPALTLFTLSFPVLWLGIKMLLQKRPHQAWATAKPLFQVALGVLLATLVLVGLSTAIFGTDAWAEWLRKVQLLDRENHLNNIAFRTYVSDSKPFWALACVASVGLLFLLLRRASLSRAAVWGVALIPIILNPANYYMHATFLMVTLAGERPGKPVRTRGLWVWLTLLGMCMASYFTNLSTDTATHFRMETGVLFVALGVLAALELGRPRED